MTATLDIKVDCGLPCDAEAWDLLDLSPLEFCKAEWHGRTLIIDPPLVLDPFLDIETPEFLVAEDPELTLFAYAPTREALQSEVVEQLFFLWDEYAREAPVKLAPAAQQLQALLQKRMREDSHAA